MPSSSAMPDEPDQSHGDADGHADGEQHQQRTDTNEADHW